MSELEKGLQGDWKSEGYTMEHSVNNDIGQHRVAVKAPNGTAAGHFIFEQVNNKWMPTQAFVSKDHRRKGIASGVYNHFETKTGNQLHPHTSKYGEDKQSDDAKALWENKMKKSDNPHTGGSFEQFLKEEGIEVLEKSCPRCGKASANKSNPSGRCSACLKKLASNKKKPGHWQRAQTKADDALRRQKGKNGTAHKKSSGLGTRASIVKQTQSAEKRTGQKLSPDRKNNGHGYAASNTRMVPEKLNRGRHHVDPKKLAAWRKRLKKSEITPEELYTYTLLKATEANDEALLILLSKLTPDTLAKALDELDELQKNQPIDKSKFKYKHAKSTSDESHYDVHHDGNLVGQIHINRKNNAPCGGQVQPAFHPLLDHISNSVKAFHLARNTKTDN
jgi:ribosomal protein S27AE